MFVYIYTAYILYQYSVYKFGKLETASNYTYSYSSYLSVITVNYWTLSSQYEFNRYLKCIKGGQERTGTSQPSRPASVFTLVRPWWQPREHFILIFGCHRDGGTVSDCIEKESRIAVIWAKKSKCGRSHSVVITTMRLAGCSVDRP